MNEWGFAGEIKSWWDALIAARPELHLGRVTIEESPEGESVRADITLYEARESRLLVLELRLPDHAQPDPNDIANINNAASKAAMVGARWSATSDGQSFRLLDHSRSDLPLRERAVPIAPLSTPADRAGLDVAAKRAQVREAWQELLVTLAPVLLGEQEAPRVPPDVFFVESLRASLARPFVASRDAISVKRASDPDFSAGLVRWMVDEQGWQHDAAKFEDEIAHVAQVATYVFATRLLFYSALRRAQLALPALELPPSGNAELARASIESIFSQAREITHDYTTVFAFDDVSRWALISDDACIGWRDVVSVLDHFKLETIGYDVLGRLFERLIDPHERYEWGQHYTDPNVVDLMLSAALPDGKGTVADFASGGGTFLVRAYTRKKAFEPSMTHEERLRQIAGGDISAFASSVSTVSLASQSLGSGSNYPQVRAGSFFTARKGSAFVSLPADGGGTEDRILPPLDAVVCNPPYIGFSHIGVRRGDEAIAAYKADGPMLPNLKGKWNYHLPFWFHGASFLGARGRLAFITAGEWYDSDYGVQLQDWLTTTFHVELVVESMAEQWFGEARVGTVVLVARKLGPKEGIDGLSTRFVTLRKPLATLYGASTADDTVRLLSVDQFRDRLLALQGQAEDDDLDHFVVPQAALRALGVVDQRYVGSTWRSRYLRSPHVAHDLDARADYVAVGDLAEVDLGAKTGADDFFFVDVLGPGATGSRRKVRGYKGWVGEIGRDHLRAAIRRPQDLDSPNGRRFVIAPRRLPSAYLAPRDRARDAGVQDYAAFAEGHRIHERDLVQSNAGRRWYQQTRKVLAAAWVLPYNSAYDYFAVDNTTARAVLNGRLVGVEPRPGVDSDLLGAVLNSTFTIAARLLVGVQTGNEGAYDVGPPAVRVMRVPDPRAFSDEGAVRVKMALDAIRKADLTPPAPSDSAAVNPLRRELDLAILEALGETRGDAAVILDRVYQSYARWRRAVKVVELQVQSNRRALAARGGSRQQDPVDRAARAVLDEIRNQYKVDVSWLSDSAAQEWLDAVAPDADHQDALLARTTVKLRSGEVVDLRDGARVRLVAGLRWLGLSGALPIATDTHRVGAFVDQFEGRKAGLGSAAAKHASTHVGPDSVPRVVERVERLWAAEQATALKAAIPQPEEVARKEGAGLRAEPSLFDAEGLVPPAPVNPL